MKTMDSKEDKLHKPNSPGRKFRLRKVFKESVDKAHLSGDSNNECEKNNTACTSQSQCDDSILDFKSPKKTHSMQSKNINNNKLSDKSKKKVSRIKIVNNERKRESKKSLQKKKTLHDAQQTSIESSFFKTEKKIDSSQSLANVRTAYVCPLCFKSLKDESSQAVHMKNCAVKNNISTKKLLDAMELQERQAVERKSLGLLSAPILQDKKKSAPRKMASHDDPDLQLALALSRSLYEKEEMEMLDEAEIMTISSSPSLPDSNQELSRRTTLQNFGFTSSRNISPTYNYPTNKIKRKGKLIEPTILQRCTAVERERILTERIAEILMGYQDFTQKLEKIEKYNNVKERIIIRSQLLQQLHQTENTLWDRTSLTMIQNVFYVKQLSPQITAVLKKERKSNEEQNITKLMDPSINSERSLDKEEMQEIKEIKTIDTANNDEELAIYSNKVKECCEEKKFLNALATNWGNILNDSSASDIIVFVKNSKHIWTHKLVFYVRCTNILLDVISNDTEFSTAKEKICWIGIDYDVALAFLEFIYSGIINKFSKILDSDTSLSAIRSLARRYKVHDLFTYLRQKEFKSNLAEVKHDHNTCEKYRENIYANMENASNVSKLGKLTFNASSNCTRDNPENTQCSQKIVLQDDVKNILQSSEDKYTFVENSCALQDEKAILMMSSKQLNSRNNTPINRTNVSPDMFDDTPDAIKCNDKSITHSENNEDSNIHVLLSLIKQDKNIDICSQNSLTRKTHSTEYPELGEGISTCLQNVEQNVMEIESDSDSNSSKLSTNDNLHKNSLTDTPQSSKPKITQDCSPNIVKQKSNLTLFIEKVQRANAKSDSDLDSDLDITIYPVQMSPIRRLNPFHIDKRDNSDNEDPESYNDNVKKPVSTEKKLGRLSIIEHCMQSYANKNPEFYPRLSNECIRDAEQTNTLLMAATPSEKMESHNNTENYIQNFTPTTEKDVNTLKQITPLPIICSSHAKTRKQSPSESDLEANEKEISMYSEYMRNRKDNSIAKYRAAIKKNRSDNNLSNESTSSDSTNENSDNDENILTQSILTQRDADVIVSSDTEIESISSSISCSSVLQNDASSHEDIISHSTLRPRKITENNKQSIANEESNQSLRVEERPKVISTNLEEEKDINYTTKSEGEKFNINDREIISGDVDFSMIFTQKKSGLNELYEDKIDYKKKFIPSPIMVSSSPDFLNMENSLPDMKHSNKHVAETDNSTAVKSADSSFNFEDDIYLANVDVDKYRKRHILEKSQSTSVLSTTQFKKDNTRRYNKKNRENLTDNIIGDVVSGCGNLDCNVMPSTENSKIIRNFGRKSLSEGQININRLHNLKSTSKNISPQFQCNYSQNIGNIKTMPKIIDKDVTPPPDYIGMRTPELHKEMKRYGLKVQKRSRAVKLLTHIYNELHPLVPIAEVTAGQEITEVSSDEEEGPPLKKRNLNDKNPDKQNNTEDSDDELPYSQDSNESMNSVKGTIRKEMEFYETESLPALENSLDIKEAFTRLINIDKDLHNKILRYEPVNIERLHVTLRSHGFKCKLSNFMNFLDEQCITFYVPEQSVRSRTRRKA